MSLLTEEELATREDIFFAVVNEIVTEHYPDVALEPLTEEDAYLFSILLDHFVEEYKNPTLYETYVASTLGQEEPDHNDALYEELVDLLLDESIGSKIASIAHGVQHFLAGRKLAKATRRTAKAQAKTTAATKKAVMYAGKVKRTAPQTTGIKSSIKSGIQQSKQEKLKAQAAKAGEHERHTQGKEYEAAAKHKTIGARRSALAQKIDTGISNIKKKATTAIHGGAHRLGRAIGKFA